METFITSLIERVPNKDAVFRMKGKLSLVRAITMDKSSAPKHREGNIRNKLCGRVCLFEVFKRSLELEDTRRHPIDKMSCNQNYISPQVRRKRGR